MFSYEERISAVKLYIASNYHVGTVIRELGYPSPVALRSWYKEYAEMGDLKKKVTHKPHFTAEQMRIAVDHYFEHGQSYTKTSVALGYPCRNILAQWVLASGRKKIENCTKTTCVLRYSDKEKQEAVLKWVSGLPDYKVAAQYGVSTATIFSWRKKFLGKDVPMECKRKHSKCCTPVKISTKIVDQAVDDDMSELEALRATVAKFKAEKAHLESQIDNLRFEKDVMEATILVLKKEEGINPVDLGNKEKTEVIDVLKKNYRLNMLLKRFKLTKSSYFYSKVVQSKLDKYQDLRAAINTIFETNYKCYGYRRVHALLKIMRVTVSEKVVRRLMAEEQLCPYTSKQKKYSSYVGEVDSAPENLVARNFHAALPNELWLTDITEFHLPSGKVYLSPVVDCFDGMVLSWTIGRHPTAELANTMLDNAIAQLSPNKSPVIHSDRGGHYRWPEWVSRTKKAGLVRFMSRKGCSQDNAACEGFFGRLKNEMFYGRSWLGVSTDAFIAQLNAYIHWYNESRIKLSLGGMSPLQYRHSLGLI